MKFKIIEKKVKKRGMDAYAKLVLFSENFWKFVENHQDQIKKSHILVNFKTSCVQGGDPVGITSFISTVST